MDDAKVQAPQHPPKLDPRVGLRGGHRVAIALVSHPAQDAVMVDIVGQWPAIGLHRVAYHLEMGPTRRAGHQEGPHHAPRVIVSGEEQRLLPPPSAGSQQWREASC
jgi:hypothetical protein